MTNILANDAASKLRERGFVVLGGSVSSERMERLAIAYNVAVASAIGDDVHIGSDSTRVADIVNRGPEFDDLYIFPPLLEAVGLKSAPPRLYVMPDDPALGEFRQEFAGMLGTL